MENKKCCSSNRTVIVDPNKFQGNDSSNNMSVPLEDLNITVALKTYKRGRTVLNSDKSVGSSESTRTVQINFLEGSNYGKDKVLTTKFTDLTTNFESGNEQENLGISNIDIDFNSSYAPMVTINFIDIRGSAIFQNEGNITNPNTDNKYSVLFQLPYPIFELTIKGYYGRPVKYCLHMTKFNTKFNSQTGNFEITANFIGYTYAMLSDMLLGVLAAIPFVNYGTNLLGFDTADGSDKIDIYQEINTERDRFQKHRIITLTDLIRDISSINDRIGKISANSESAKTVTASDKQITLIADIEGMLKNLYGTGGIDLKENLETASFIVFKSTSHEMIKDKKVPISVARQVKDINMNKLIAFQRDIKAKITEFNSENGVKFTDEEIKLFTTLNAYKNMLTLKSIRCDRTKFYCEDLKSLTSYFPEDIVELQEYAKRYNGIVTDTTLLDVLRLVHLNEIIEEKKNSINNKKNDSSVELANEVATNMETELGFVPTIRNIVEIFTTSVEAFMRTLYRVSVIAEGSQERFDVLKNYFKDDRNSDIKDITSKTQYFAWPDYNEHVDGIGYVETYLGKASGISSSDKEKITELVFIDKLLEAFRLQAKKAKEDEVALANEEKNWIPVNPLDSPVFNPLTSAYSQIEGNSWEEVMSLMLTRAMGFLYFSSSSLSNEDINKMAESEVNSIINNSKNAVVKKSLKELRAGNVLDVNGVINNSKNKVITRYQKDDLKWYYKYSSIGVSGTFKNGSTNVKYSAEVLPFVKPNTKNYGTTFTQLSNITDYFLTNYSNTTFVDTNSKIIKKESDGSWPLRIFSIDEFTQKPTKELIETIDTTNTISLEKIKVKDFKDLKSAGFNPFGGVYGVQEFVNLDYGNDDLKDLPLMYVFYSDMVADDDIDKNHFTTPRSIPSKYDLSQPFLKPENAFNNHFKESLKLMTSFGKNRHFFNNKNYKTAAYPFINLHYSDSIDLSLFGSVLYYGQYDFSTSKRLQGRFYNYAQALLFLSTFPWNGDTFDSPEIINLFKHASGFIHVPKLWCIYVGGLMWRADDSEPKYSDDKLRIIGGGSGPEDPILWKDLNGKLFFQRSRDKNESIGDLYDTIDLNPVLTNLPEIVKDQFKNEFLNWVNGLDSKDNNNWPFISNKLVIWGQNPTKFSDKLTVLFNNPTGKKNNFITTNFPLINEETYRVAYPVINAGVGGYLYQSIGLELNGDYNTNIAMKTIIDSMNEEVVIANNNFRIWNNTDDTELYNPLLYVNLYDTISVSEDQVKTYVNTVIAKLKEKIVDGVDEKKEMNKELFGSSDENAIKIHLYRLCKNIYDKWIGDAGSEDRLFFQCGSASTHKAMGEHLRGVGTTPRLIDSFRFISRNFEDIGDKLYVNPLPVKDFLVNNPNSSFYNVVTTLLSANNFDFIALPSYINYRTEEGVADVFKTIQFDKEVEEDICGPSFVCVYVGQASKNLTNGSYNYTNDGVDLQCNEKGDFIKELPEDFTTTIPAEHESLLAGFNVNFSQQNQNIFKDITLDQSEFTETAESLQIVDAIANTGSENNRTLAGQNIYNVYSVRSYKVGIEMLGNAMIQPMMYFQLNNIPMFHGAYMITHVKHNIKPNFMSTNFTGVRIRYPKTPLITENEMYQSLLVSLGLIESVGTGVSQNLNGNYPNIVATIIDFDATTCNGNISTMGKSLSSVFNGKGLGISYEKNDILIKEATDAFFVMFKDWDAWMVANGWSKTKNRLTVTSTLRSLGVQQSCWNTYQTKGSPVAAVPGTSNHGWGIAVDVNYTQKDGTVIGVLGDKKSLETYFNPANNPAIDWLYKNSVKYGWVLPINEYWHLEYWGTSANCNKLSGGKYPVTIPAKYESCVINPIDSKTGKPAVYTGCNKQHREKSFDGSNVDTSGIEITGNNPKDALKFFITTKKYPSWKAIGIIAAMMPESGADLDPTATNKTSGAYGIAQWLGDRKAKLLKNSNSDTLKTQLAFLFTEVDVDSKTIDSIAKPFLKKASTKEQMYAAMQTMERGEDAIAYAKEGDGIVYSRTYDKVTAEAIAKKSSSAYFSKGIGYLTAVETLYNTMKKNGEL